MREFTLNAVLTPDSEQGIVEGGTSDIIRPEYNKGGET